MHVQSVNSSNGCIRPVILAASRQRRLWPLSTPETPFCLRSINSRPAPLVSTLQALDANSAFGAPIVILAECAARLGVAEITRIRPDALIILVPDSIGSGISSVLAAIEVSNSCASRHIALIPGSFYAADPREAFLSLAAIAAQCLQIDQVALMTGRSIAFSNQFKIELDVRVKNSSLFRVKRFHQFISEETKALLKETNSLVNASGPALVSTQSLLNHIQANFPTTYVACHNALKLADKYGQTHRPQQDFLSFGGRPTIHDYFQSVLPSLQAFIGNPNWRTIESFKDSIFDEYNTQPIIPVSIVGAADQRVIASNDGILILKSGHEDAVKDLYPEIYAAQNGAFKPFGKGPSLRFIG
jgi:mannose-1-phosphate guanylyltransferase